MLAPVDEPRAQPTDPHVEIGVVKQGESAAAIAACLGREGLPTTLSFGSRGQLVETQIGELSQSTQHWRSALLPAASRSIGPAASR